MVTVEQCGESWVQWFVWCRAVCGLAPRPLLCVLTEAAVVVGGLGVAIWLRLAWIASQDR